MNLIEPVHFFGREVPAGCAAERKAVSKFQQRERKITLQIYGIYPTEKEKQRLHVLTNRFLKAEETFNSNGERKCTS